MHQPDIDGERPVLSGIWCRNLNKTCRSTVDNSDSAVKHWGRAEFSIFSGYGSGSAAQRGLPGCVFFYENPRESQIQRTFGDQSKRLHHVSEELFRG